MDKVHIEGSEARAASPEGTLAGMPLADLMAKLNPRRFDSGDLILPDGVKAVRSEGPITIVVHETPPQVYSLKWIAGDSVAPDKAEHRIRELTSEGRPPYAVVYCGGMRVVVLSSFLTSTPVASTSAWHVPAL